MQTIFNVIDPVLIFPYRAFTDPMLGWGVGTCCLAMWSVLLGEVTVSMAAKLNRSAVLSRMDDTNFYHEQSLKAKAAGDEKAYRGINRLANEAYGKSFFLLMAMGMAGLWPAFFAAAWLSKRFGAVTFQLPVWAGGVELNFIAPFILAYVTIRMALGRIKKGYTNDTWTFF